MRVKTLKWACTLAAVAVLAVTAASASTVLGLTIEDQARLSTWVVVGEVTGLQGIDDPDNGLETAVTLRVERALKGDARIGDAVVFHTRSGELNGEISEAVGEATFHLGDRVLVFIETIDGRPYNIGLSYGVFNVLEDRSGRVSVVRAVKDDLEIFDDAGTGNGPFAIEEIAARVRYAQRNPRYDNAMVREAFQGGN